MGGGCTSRHSLQDMQQSRRYAIEWFSSPEELRIIVGGTRWWQVRGLDGLEAEWVTEKSYLNYDGVQELANKRIKEGRKLSDNESEILAMDGLERVMVSKTQAAYV